jgi:hypothetical protein
MTSPSVSDHLRATGTDHRDGVYRVVGTDTDSVTLLLVGDSDGTRIVTGDIVTVARGQLDGFEPAEKPAEGRSLPARLRGMGEHLYWSLRTFVGQLARHPVPAAVALAIAAVGVLGEGIVPLPDAALSVLTVVGGLGLAVVGSGRL